MVPLRGLLRRTGRAFDRLARRSRFGGFWTPPLEGEDEWEVGLDQIAYLKKEGLQRDHFLLDLPCASFRGGRLFIDYLDKGHYFGLDRNAKSIARGEELVLRPAGLLAKAPFYRQLELGPEPNDFYEILKTKFDYIWLHALFDHIPPETIRRCLLDLSQGVLKPGGRLYATIFLNPHGPEFREPIVRPRRGSLERSIVTFPDREYWHHTVDFFEAIARETPYLRLDACLYDYPHPLGLRLLRFIRDPAAPRA